MGTFKEESRARATIPSRQAIDVVTVRAPGVQYGAIVGGKPMATLSKAAVKGLVVVVAGIIFSLGARAGDDAPLSKEQIKHFLQTAEIIKSKQSSKGVTHPWRLTLSDGTLTHDASFQPIDEHKAEMKLESGKVERNFVDSYKYNIAAYRLAELVGFDDMMPVYVERKWQGKTG